MLAVCGGAAGVILAKWGLDALLTLAPTNLPRSGEIHLNPAGTLRTGAGEDSRVYVSLQDFRAWTAREPSVVEIAASGVPEEVSSLLRNLQQTLPGAEVNAVRQVAEGEANVLGKTRLTLLSSAAFIVSEYD